MNKHFYGIKFKLLVAVFTTLVIAVSTVDFILFIKTKEYGTNLVKTNESRLTAQISQGIDNTLEAGNLVFFYISINQTVTKIISSDFDKNSSDFVFSVITISEQLNNLMYLSDTIVDITLINNNGAVYSLGIHREMMEKYLKESWYTDFISSKEGQVFTPVHTMERNLQGASQEKRVVKTISYLRKIIDPSNPSKTIGTVSISYNIAAFGSKLDLDNQSNNSYILVNDDKPAFSQGEFKELPADLIKNSELIEDKTNSIYTYKDKYIVIANPLKTNNFILYTFVQIENINREVRNITFFCTMIGILVALLSCFVFIPFANRIIKPLIKLNRAVKRIAEGDFDIKIDPDTNDEIHELSTSVNHMTEEIKILIQKTKDEEKNKNEAQMKFLMAQINPHFVYNTLNSVIYLARQRKTNEIIGLVSKFITLLQKTIKPKLYYTKIQDEIDLLSAYVAVQSYRYGDLIDLVFDISKSDYDSLIPSMVLQPIVENAIIHGILPADKKCKIIINISSDENTSTIKVSNEGITMSDEKIRAVRNSLTENETSNAGIALKNIYERLNILYPGKASLLIDSLPNGGSIVTITIDKSASDFG